MKKNNLLFLLLILIGFSNRNYGQELFSKIPIEVTNVNSKKTISVVDNENNIYLFFISSSEINYIKQNSSKALVYKKTYNSSKPYSFSKIQGYHITEDNNVVIYFSNDWNTKYSSVTFYKEEKKEPTTKEFEIKKKKERFLISVNGTNKFHVYTFIKNSSILKRYDISEDIKDVITYDLSKERFYDHENKICKLSKIIRSREISVIENNISNSISKANALDSKLYTHLDSRPVKDILNPNRNTGAFIGHKKSKPIRYSKDNITPNSIDIASKKIKLYINDYEHILTLNHRKSATRVIHLKENNKTDVRFFTIPTRLFTITETIDSNSFVFENKIYQFICSKKRMILNAYNFNTKELIKEYTFNNKENLNIINSPIMQKGGTLAFGGERELTSTSQFLGKLAFADKVGIYAFRKGEKLNLTIGGTSKISVISNVNLFSIPISSGLIFSAYVSYNTSKSMFINCLFDSDSFEHIKGKPDQNIFDRIIKYSEYLKKINLTKRMKLETLFNYNDFYMQGYYDKKAKSYFLKTYR